MKDYNIERPNVQALTMEPGQTATSYTAVLPGSHNVGPKVNPVERQNLHRYATLIAAILLILSTAPAFAQPAQARQPRFHNVAVSRWNLSEVSNLRAIHGFDVAVFGDSVGETIFNWMDGTLTSIVTSVTGMFNAFDDAFGKITYVFTLLTED